MQRCISAACTHSVPSMRRCCCCRQGRPSKQHCHGLHCPASRDYNAQCWAQCWPSARPIPGSSNTKKLSLMCVSQGNPTSFGQKDSSVDEHQAHVGCSAVSSCAAPPCVWPLRRPPALLITKAQAGAAAATPASQRRQSRALKHPKGATSTAVNQQ